MRTLYASIAVLSLTAGGCATIVSGSTQKMTFNSEPEGATVTMDGTALGKTPLSFAVERDKHYSVSLSKPGYKTFTAPLESRLNGWFWGNIVFGGFLGSTTDDVSGAMHEYSPGRFLVSLVPAEAGKLEIETSKGPRQKAREFIVIDYSNITADLAKGQGEHLRSLLEMLTVPADRRDDAAKKLRELSAQYPNIMDFAERAIDLYMEAPPEALGAPTEEAPDADLTGWTAVQNAKPADQYRFLVDKETSAAEKCLSTLLDHQKTALTLFILREKGKRAGFTWNFTISPALSERERNFVAWYVSTQTDYKPKF